MATNAKTTSRLKVLKRRRDYLAKIIAESQEPLSWDKAEKSALDWAISELEDEESDGATKALSSQSH